MDPTQEAYDELYAYTMGRDRQTFILQHVVDAGVAQIATPETVKPIGITFALVGLYLHVERAFSGRRVQDVHVQLGRLKPAWPPIVYPVNRGSITPIDVIAKPAGAERDAAVDEWCRSVWTAYRDENRSAIVELLRAAKISGS